MTASEYMNMHLEELNSFSIIELDNLKTMIQKLIDQKTEQERINQEKIRKRNEEIAELKKRLEQLEMEAKMEQSEPVIKPARIACPKCSKMIACDSVFCCYCGYTLKKYERIS